MSHQRKSVVSDLLKFSLNCEKTGRELGQGSYATVMELSYKGLKCAGKNIHCVLYRQSGEELVARFSEECRLLSELRHPNIVQFLGVHFESDNTPVLVLEYIPITLSLCLERNGTMPEDINYSILMDVILGLRYLHEQAPPIIHRDLSANNVLLTENLTAKISDLGVAKIVNVPISRISRLTSVPGTPCYMPPEALVPTPKYNSSIDIFSYGVLILHTFSGQWPLPTEANIFDPDQPNQLVPVSEADRRSLYMEGWGAGHPMVRLASSCLNNNFTLRPKAVEIWKDLLEASADHKPSYRTKLEVLMSLMGEAEPQSKANERRGVASSKPPAETSRKSGFNSDKRKVTPKTADKPSHDAARQQPTRNVPSASPEHKDREFGNEGRKQTNSMKTSPRETQRADSLISKFQSMTTSPKPAAKPQREDTGKPSWRGEIAEKQQGTITKERPNTQRSEDLKKLWSERQEKREQEGLTRKLSRKGTPAEERPNMAGRDIGEQIDGVGKLWRGAGSEKPQGEGLNKQWRESEKSQDNRPPKKKISDNWLANAGKTNAAADTAQPGKIKIEENPNSNYLNVDTQQPAERQPPSKAEKKKQMATALYDFQARTTEELTIRKGDLIEILEGGPDTAQGQWLLARNGTHTGTVPSTYIDLVVEPEPSSELPPRNLPGSGRGQQQQQDQSAERRNTWGQQSQGKQGAPQNTWGQQQQQQNVPQGGRGGAPWERQQQGDNQTEGVRRRLRSDAPPPTSNRASISIDKNEFSKRKKFVAGLFGIPESQPSQPQKPVTPAWSAPEEAQAQQQMPQKQKPVAPAWSAPEEPVYVALYPYTAADEDEVSFCKGDEAIDVSSIGEGWLEGMIVQTGEYGMLPSNYFQMK